MKMTEVATAQLTETFSAGVFVKVSFRDEIRKFKIVDYERPYEDILNFFLDQYDIESYRGGNIRISYIDDDQDEITMSSNREVADALTSLSKTSDCIKLRIKDRDCADESGSDTGGEAQITESSSEVVPKMESADSVAEEGVSDLQKEIDNVITGLRHSKVIGEEPVTVQNIFTSFQGEQRRQFELVADTVQCKVCVGRTMEPTTDLQLIRTHARSDVHMMALTYHVLGDWPAMPQYLPPHSVKTEPAYMRASDANSDYMRRSLDTTAAQLLAYHQLQAKPQGQRRKRTSFSPATTLALEQFANAVNWKRGESDRINEFAQKHGLTFYQVKVWMNNHRPRKAVMHPGHYMNNMSNISSVNNNYGLNHHGNQEGLSNAGLSEALHSLNRGSLLNPNTPLNEAEISKVIAALEEPLHQKMNSTIPTSLSNLFSNSPIKSPHGLASLASSIGSLVSSAPSYYSHLSSLTPLTARSPFSLPNFSTPVPFTSDDTSIIEEQIKISQASSPQPLMAADIKSIFSSSSKQFSPTALSPNAMMGIPTTLSPQQQLKFSPQQQLRLSPLSKTSPSSFSPTSIKLEPYSMAMDSAFRPPSFSNAGLHFHRPSTAESMGSGS